MEPIVDLWKYYMMERMITHGSVSAPDYPYNAAEMVVDYIYPEFGNDKLNIIALCDACLQFSEPGKIFVHWTKSRMHC